MLVCTVAPASAQGYIGRVDTIGGTTYDWQVNGPIWRRLVNSPEYGIYAGWMYSASTSGTTFPDRNLRYNAYDISTRSWAYIDPDYMQSGVNAFAERAGYGNLTVAPGTGVVYASAHTDRPVVVDLITGGVSEGPTGYQWPVIDCSGTDRIHVAMYRLAGGLYYSAVPWDTVIPLGDPGFPTHNIAASKVSGKVCVIWEVSTDWPEDGYMQMSTDDGATWTNPVQFLPPVAYGGDTVASFHITSLYPYYDWGDRLHIVANVMPIVHDTGYIVPAQIWHYCADNSPQWSRIHIATCDPAHLQAPVGYNATYACRPSIGEGNDGRLYVAWEQFDSSNVEPLTERLRAGVWVSGSPDNGVTWTPGLLVTKRNTFSHRFPSIVDRVVSGVPSEDTICILYLMDEVAGFFVQNEGPATPNPVICQFIPSPLVGAEETMNDERGTMNVGPTIVRGVLRLPEARSEKREARSELLDISGRKVLELRPGPNDVRSLAPGVYFVRPEPSAASRQAPAVSKIVTTR
jgi:hypothetical protein